MSYLIIRGPQVKVWRKKDKKVRNGEKIWIENWNYLQETWSFTYLPSDYDIVSNVWYTVEKVGGTKKRTQFWDFKFLWNTLWMQILQKQRLKGMKLNWMQYTYCLSAFANVATIVISVLWISWLRFSTDYHFHDLYFYLSVFHNKYQNCKYDKHSREICSL